MTDAAVALTGPMTVETFLTLHGDPETRYELIDGEAVAMATGSVSHNRIIAAFTAVIERRLKAPCFTMTPAQIRLPHRDDAFYVADLAVSCTPITKSDTSMKAPITIVEVLSPSTEGRDRGMKRDDYARIESVREILLVSSTARRVQRWVRQGDRDLWQVETVIGAGAVHLDIIADVVSLDEIYRGVPLEEGENA